MEKNSHPKKNPQYANKTDYFMRTLGGGILGNKSNPFFQVLEILVLFAFSFYDKALLVLVCKNFGFD